jgi:hypothetical protein
MRLSRQPNNIFVLDGIPTPIAEILRSIPSWHAGSSQAAEERIFPSPCEDSMEGMEDDWKAHVQPGLHETFLAARETVAADLRRMSGHEPFRLEIPESHAEAWLNALNQARLAMAATHNLTEKEMARRPVRIPRTPRQLARLHMDVLAAIQEWLVAALEGEL